MCRPCWALVPRGLGALMYEFFKAGLRSDTHPSGAWMLAADAAIAVVHVANDRTPNAVQLTRAMAYARRKDGEIQAITAARRVLLTIENDALRNAMAVVWEVTAS